MEWQNIDFDRAEWGLPIEQLTRRQIEKDARRGEIGLIVPLPRLKKGWGNLSVTIPVDLLCANGGRQ